MENKDPQSGYCRADGIFYGRGPPCNLPPPSQDADLPSQLFANNDLHPDRNDSAALVDGPTGDRLSYRQLRQNARAIAAGLHALGIRKGDVVLVMAPNSIMVPCIYLGVLSVGAILTTANPLSTVAEIQRHVDTSNSVLVFAVADLVPKVSAAASRLPIILVTEDRNPSSSSSCVSTLHRLLQSDAERAPSVKIKQHDAATLLYSSGTSGKTKAVVGTHRNHIAVMRSGVTRVTPGSPCLGLIPIYHVFGFCMVTNFLWAEATVVVLPKFNMDDMLAAIQRYRVTFAPLAPPVFLALARSPAPDRYDLTSVRHFFLGGAPAAKEVIREFRARFPTIRVTQSYGLTEAGGAVSASVNDEENERCGTAGKLINSVEAKVVDIVSAKPLPPNQTGELWLRGPSIMKGYLNDKEATMAALDSEGWLKTGDLCYIDDEGYLFIVDRLKELIKYKAFQVAPAELEELLLTNPEISDAAVIPYPDEQAGQIPMAYVARISGSKLSAEDVMNFVAKEVAPYKRIRRVAFVNSIPRNSAGKVLRKNFIQDINATSRL